MDGMDGYLMSHLSQIVWEVYSLHVELNTMMALIRLQLIIGPPPLFSR